MRRAALGRIGLPVEAAGVDFADATFSTAKLSVMTIVSSPMPRNTGSEDLLSFLFLGSGCALGLLTELDPKVAGAVARRRGPLDTCRG